MKFYNVFSGFLTGTTREAYMRNIGDNIFNSLHSYWYLKDCSDEKIIDGFAITKGNIMIDSGAFTAWTKNIDIDVDKYLNWINKWDSYITTFGQIDVIPDKGNLTEEYIDQCCQRTWQNYIYMTERMNSPKKLLYTFHFGEPFKWLKYALEYKDKNGQPMEYMAFGGLVGRTTKERTKFLDECFKIIRESSNPNIKVHGFGVSSKSMWHKYPFESCDSFTPGMQANHGYEYDEKGKAFRSPDYYNIFPPLDLNKKKDIDCNIFGDDEVLYPIPEKSEEVLQEESLERVDAKAKLLIKNIKFWTDEGNKVNKQKIINAGNVTCSLF